MSGSRLLRLNADEIAALSFRELRPGVEIHVLHETPGGARAALLRYAPGASVPPHLHQGAEYIYVLEGTQADGLGTYGPGSFVINEAGSRHAVTSSAGCVVLIVWERPVRFLDGSQ
jgi:anti-sigma factor ChrR (cupin superfamily)